MILLVSLACLPPTALSRQAEFPSDRYHLECVTHTVTEGAAVPAFDWRLEATLDLAYTRTFRDHSIGTLLQITEATSTVEGQTFPSDLQGLLVEMRAFDRGEVLAIIGADAGVGLKKHLEVLDMLWPALAPRVEEHRGNLSLRTSWPVAENWRLGRNSLDAKGTMTREKNGSILEWSGTLQQADKLVDRQGTVEGRSSIDDRNDRTLQSHWVVNRTVRPLWREGIQQTQSTELTLVYLGPAAPLPIQPPPELDSRYADLLPLVLSDGRALQHPDVVVESALPFLVFPDTWSDQQLLSAMGG